MTPLPRHRPVAAHATVIGDADPDHRIVARIEVRRRADHWPIPQFDHFKNTIFPRLPNDVFAERYGASEEDLEAVHQHYSAHGLTTEKIHASRSLVIDGTVAQHSAAFNAPIKKWAKTHGKIDVEFIAPHGPVMVPDHLEDIILCVHGLGNEPTVHVSAPLAAIEPTNTVPLTAAQIMTLYKTPTNLATGQVIAIPVVSQDFGSFSQTDLNLTCTAAGFTAPSPTRIVIGVDFTQTNTLATGEQQLDVSMAALFGRGAGIVIFNANNLPDILARVVAPQSGDPITTIISCSFGANETAFSADLGLYWEDLAIQGVTVLNGSGDWGSSPSNPTDATVQCSDATNPWSTAVGQTVIGNVSPSSPVTSSSTFDEWMANDGNYFNVSGGGVSLVWPKPSYQTATIPASLSTAPTNVSNEDAPVAAAVNAGRGIPDITAIGSVFSGPNYYQNGVLFRGGGSSQSTPIMAGIFARINAALGSNMGFINPTLYHLGYGSASIRAIPSASAPNSPSNNGDFNGFGAPGYYVTSNWNPCTGLGVIVGTAFLAYLQANTKTAQNFTNYYIRVVSTNANGTSEAVGGPFAVPEPY